MNLPKPTFSFSTNPNNNNHDLTLSVSNATPKSKSVSVETLNGFSFEAPITETYEQRAKRFKTIVNKFLSQEAIEHLENLANAVDPQMEAIGKLGQEIEIACKEGSTVPFQKRLEMERDAYYMEMNVSNDLHSTELVDKLDDLCHMLKEILIVAKSDARLRGSLGHEFKDRLEYVSDLIKDYLDYFPVLLTADFVEQRLSIDCAMYILAQVYNFMDAGLLSEDHIKELKEDLEGFPEPNILKKHLERRLGFAHINMFCEEYEVVKRLEFLLDLTYGSLPRFGSYYLRGIKALLSIEQAYPGSYGRDALKLIHRYPIYDNVCHVSPKDEPLKQYLLGLLNSRVWKYPEVAMDCHLKVFRLFSDKDNSIQTDFGLLALSLKEIRMLLLANRQLIKNLENDFYGCLIQFMANVQGRINSLDCVGEMVFLAAVHDWKAFGLLPKEHVHHIQKHYQSSGFVNIYITALSYSAQQALNDAGKFYYDPYLVVMKMLTVKFSALRFMNASGKNSHDYCLYESWFWYANEFLNKFLRTPLEVSMDSDPVESNETFLKRMPLIPYPRQETEKFNSQLIKARELIEKFDLEYNKMQE